MESRQSALGELRQSARFWRRRGGDLGWAAAQPHRGWWSGFGGVGRDTAPRERRPSSRTSCCIGNQWFGRAWPGFLWCRYEAVCVFGLCFLQVDNHPVQIVIKPGRLLLAHPPYFFQKVVLHNIHFNISSFGVHITGISNPATRQAAPSSPPMAALARCRQFHVSRKCIRCTAATARCKASFDAFPLLFKNILFILSIPSKPPPPQRLPT